MKVIDYLKAKYGVNSPTTILSVEANVFGIPQPLEKGWLHKYGSDVISNDAAKLLKRKLEDLIKRKKNIESAKKGLQVLSDAHIELKNIPEANSVDFLQSKSWKRLRLVALEKYGNRCQCCGASPKDGVRLNVDHIKPRRLFPNLALSLENLQVLCSDCNEGKGNWNMSDFRETNNA